MATVKNERELLQAVRDRLEGWLYEAREQAFVDLFEGPDATLSGEELRLIDQIDFAWSRE